MYNYSITQSQNNPAFCAVLKKNPFMEAGRKRCIELTKEGSAEALETVNKFVNELNFIKNDKSMSSFTVDAYPEDLFHPLFPGLHYVGINSKRVGNYTLENIDAKTEGDYCIAAVDEFVKRHYGEEIGKFLAAQRTANLNKLEELKIDNPNYNKQLLKSMRELSGMAKSINLEV